MTAADSARLVDSQRRAAAKSASSRGPLGAALLVGALLVGGALWITRSPTIEFIPNTLRCDGSVRTMILRLPGDVSRITVEMRSGGVAGPVLISDTASVSALGAERAADGSYRIETTTYDAWECRQAPGRYAMVIRDPQSGRTLGEAEFSIVP